MLLIVTGAIWATWPGDALEQRNYHPV